MKVQPIIEMRDIRSIKRLLADKPRDKLLFTIGCNAGLRVQDLLALRIGDVRHLKVGDRIPVKEKKTGKSNVIIANKEIMAALNDHLSDFKGDDEIFLFKSRKGKNYPLTTLSVTKKVKEWTSSINLKGNYGAHTLRKTWTYHQRFTFGTSFSVLSSHLNHSSPSTTMRYIGVTEAEITGALNHCI